ncbi:nucleoside phosphorylase [[Eubacterium] cellulosolvens]
MADTLQYHIKCRKGDVARYVLLPGDPARVKVIASLWDESHKVAENRQYITYTGKISGADISTTSTGIGSPSTAIAVEELARCGADTFIRVGTCGGYQKNQRIGDIAISTGAVRWEGTTRQYVPIEYPAFGTPEVVMALVEAAERIAVDYHVGITRSGDGLYAGMAFGGYQQSWMKNVEADFTRANVISAEMEASTIFTLASLFRLRAGSVCSIIDLVIADEAQKHGQELSVEEAFQPKPEFILRSCRCAVEAVKILDKWDRDKQAKGKKNWFPSLSYTPRD